MNLHTFIFAAILTVNFFKYLKNKNFALLRFLRNLIDGIEVKERCFAHLVCQLIPAQCPFERRIELGGRTLLYIPPLCKLNPLYDEVVALRFRALCYLAESCDEDISLYC